MEMTFTVTEEAMRPGLPMTVCFYCKKPVGSKHKNDCVLVSKRMKMRAVVDFTMVVPASWDKGQIEFHCNESSWCANNVLDDMQKHADRFGCLCSCATITALSPVSEPFLDEK